MFGKWSWCGCGVIKNCEGFDRIPQRVLVDGIDILIDPLNELFGLVYHQRDIPEQWLIAKTIPVHKPL